MIEASPVATLRAIGALLRDERPDRGLGPARQFDRAVQRIIEGPRDWRDLTIKRNCPT